MEFTQTLHTCQLALRHWLTSRHPVVHSGSMTDKRLLLINNYLVRDPAIQLPGFNLFRLQRLMLIVPDKVSHSRACHKRWGWQTASSVIMQTTSHIITSADKIWWWSVGIMHWRVGRHWHLEQQAQHSLPLMHMTTTFRLNIALCQVHVNKPSPTNGVTHLPWLWFTCKVNHVVWLIYSLRYNGMW